MTYKAKVIKFPFNKTYKCKGHSILKELDNTIMLILENEERVFIPNNYIIEFDDGWFRLELEKVKEEGKGQVNIDHNLKNG